MLARLSGGRDALRTAGGTPALQRDAGATISAVKIAVDFDNRVRLFVYRFMLREERSPTVREIAAGLRFPVAKIRAALARLSESHAFMLQENGELWRAAPFSCIPTGFLVTIGKRTWFANCIWDALGIPAMLDKDAEIKAACGCCNYDMPLEIHDGKLSSSKGVIHIAVPAREWYKDVVFT